MEFNACKEARSLLGTINIEQGNVSGRKWSTRVKNVPTKRDVDSVNRIVSELLA